MTDTNNLTSVAKTTVNPTSAQISYVGSATFNANTTQPVVTIPGATQAGDGLVLVVSYGTTTVVPTAPSGWTLKGQLVDGSMSTQVYSRVATSTDANSQVAVPLSALNKVAMSVGGLPWHRQWGLPGRAGSGVGVDQPADHPGGHRDHRRFLGGVLLDGQVRRHHHRVDATGLGDRARPAPTAPGEER